MNSLSALLASALVLLPASALLGAEAQDGRLNLTAEQSGKTAEPAEFDISGSNPWRTFMDAHRPRDRNQVRIEQRVIMRITPRPQQSRTDLLAEFPRSEPPTHIEERKIGSCVSVEGIASVGTDQNNRLILFMRDRRIVSAALEKACRARDFYSGFYVRKSEDGRICVKRDQIQSRAGAKCELRQLRELVAVKD